MLGGICSLALVRCVYDAAERCFWKNQVEDPLRGERLAEKRSGVGQLSGEAPMCWFSQLLAGTAGGGDVAGASME